MLRFARNDGKWPEAAVLVTSARYGMVSEMDLNQLPILAKIELLSAEEGGREALLLGPVSFRPNHNFFGENDREMCMGAIELGEGQSIAPGEAIEVNMVLWVWPSLAREIYNGRRWRLQEGAKLVGWGTVLGTAGF